jgi:hypothetical protein
MKLDITDLYDFSTQDEYERKMTEYGLQIFRQFEKEREEKRLIKRYNRS